MPVCGKSTIYYPLATFKLAAIRAVFVVTTPREAVGSRRLLGDCEQLGVPITYARRPSRDRLAQAFTIGVDHIGEETVGLVPGDDILYGTGLGQRLRRLVDVDGGAVFEYQVADHRHTEPSSLTLAQSASAA